MIKHVKDCLLRTDSKLPLDILGLSGMSTPKIRHLLNNIVSMPGARYLEVGLWRGATFISALYGNSPEYACGVDDWMESNKSTFLKNSVKYINGCDILTGDAFEVKPEKNINIYLYDASHTRGAQYMALDYYYEFLADKFIFLVDDYNHESVRKGTDDAIKDLGLKILFDKWLGEAEYSERVPREWWLGFYVAVLKK